ncbi:MAG TPA: DUF2489 domain-containing protein [Marinobacterium sp.]|nr:DUF2489 domain-containing protein [Marinobacterium sp.]
MSTELTYTLILGGVAIIVALGLLIYKQLNVARAQREANEERLAKHAAEAQKHRDYLLESSKVIANAILNDDKITLTEGCIRLKVMLDNLDPQLHQHPHYGVFEEVYNRTSHIPILTDWRELERQQQRAFEKEMRAIERDCENRINEAAKRLLKDPILQGH